MSTPDPEDDALLDYVAAFREVERPAPGVSDKTWTEIERATTPTRIPWVAIAAVAIAASLLVALLVDWRALLSDTAEPEPSQAPYEAEREGEIHGLAAPKGDRAQHPAAKADPTREPQRDPDPTPAPESQPSPDVEVHADPDARPKSEPSTRSHADPTPAKRSATPKPSTLAEETALLRAIQEALVQNKANLALGKVAAYRQRFPKGVFHNEVTVAKAQALCKVGRPEQARARR